MENKFIIDDFKLIYPIILSFNIPIFLDAGTLLGAIREQNIIDGDKDLDFGMFRKNIDRNKEAEIKNKLTSNGFEFKGYECQAFINRLEPNFIPYVLKFKGKMSKCNIDFHVFEERKNDYYHRGWLGYFHFLKENLDTLDNINFLGFAVQVPHNPEKYLELHYGKDWRTPKYMSSSNKAPHYPNWSKELKNE